MNAENRTIVFNTFILYSRLFITSIIGLLATRYILKGLGVDDFGIYAVIGGFVSLMAFVNTIMLSATNRFIAFEVGRNLPENINRIFNASRLIHIIIAAIVLLLAFTIGRWYIIHYVNLPDGRLEDALHVFKWSVLGSAIAFVGVPYNGFLLAKEKFAVFCSTEIVVSFAKLIVALFLLRFSGNRLLFYAILMAGLTALPTFVYWVYCQLRYRELVRWDAPSNFQVYRELLSFSVWTGYGALATVGKVQGAALLINFFFGVAFNAAFGIANSVNAILVLFCSNVGKAISPQITKSYARGDLCRMEKLVIASSKYSFFLMLLPAVPLFLKTEYILGLWLGEVPSYTSIFIRLMIVDALIGTLNAGIPEAIFATGRIKAYQLIVNTLFLMSLPLAYLLLQSYPVPSVILYSYIIISVIVLFVRQFILHYIIKFNNKNLLYESYIPAIKVLILVLLSGWLISYFQPKEFVVLFGPLVCTVFFIYWVGLTNGERQTVKKGFTTLFNRF